ncbi:MAG: hypothetical protein ACRDIE_02040 [Chloroflexota bacterium]
MGTGGVIPPTDANTTDEPNALPPFAGNPIFSPGRQRVESAGAKSPSANDSEALPPEADGANPLTLAPSDPMRESDEGEPYLDDANPYGRRLKNRQERPMGGIGTTVDPKDSERPHDRTEEPMS